MGNRFRSNAYLDLAPNKPITVRFWGNNNNNTFQIEIEYVEWFIVKMIT